MPVREKSDEDKDRVLVHKIRQGFVALGQQKMSLPLEIGGLGMRPPVDTCIIGEEIGRGDLGIAAETMISGSWIWLPAMHFSNKSVIKKLMAPYAGDKVLNGCIALIEPQRGCKIESMAAQGHSIRGELIVKKLLKCRTAEIERTHLINEDCWVAKASRG